MQKFSFSICFMLLCIIAFSQEKHDSLKNEIGIGFSDIGFAFGGRHNFFPTTNLSYKRVYDKNVFRSGISYNYFSTEEYTPGKKQNFNYLLTNVGYERRFLMNKKWELLAGIDLCYSYKSASVKFDTDFRSSIYQIGIGPVVGLIYNPNKRWSFQTELGLFYGPAKEKTTIGGKSTWTSKGSYLSAQRLFNFHVYYHF